MAAGYRSPLALWVGGAGSQGAQAGVTSLLAPWIGGAGVAPAVSQGGARGLLAFWMGGAATTPQAVVVGAESPDGFGPIRTRRRVRRWPIDSAPPPAKIALDVEPDDDDALFVIGLI